MTPSQVVTRVAFLNTHPIQYFAPLYAYLNRAPDLKVSAVYLADYSVRGGHDHAFGRTVQWDVDLLNGYDARFVSGAERRQEARGFLSMVVPHVARYLSGFDAVVVHGHTPAAMLIGAAAARWHGAAIFMRAETHLGLRKSRVKAAIRKPLMNRLYNACDGVLAIGTANAEFYRSMGVPASKIFLMPYAVDNERFARSRGIGARVQLRSQLGVADERPIILYAAKLSERKRPADLLRAAADLNALNATYALVIAGSGELESELRSLTASLRLSNVHFTGFVNQAALPDLYGASDIFVLPSENEPWGLAVNEAMCAGLPIVVSKELGCVPDLVHDGVNGYTYRAGDIAALTAALHPLVSSKTERERMGAASRDLISRWSYAECLQGLRRALTCTRVKQGYATTA